ncbi:hypothetical protein S40293_09400 [Stachybotrys chartarum IBT 40293]|nr:hypothetical protein S40293_09400 [Stachybotrys chartarum IBT 40293]
MQPAPPRPMGAVCSRRGQYRINSSSSYPIVPSDDTNTTSQPLQQKSNRRSPAIDDVQEKDKEEGEEMEEEEYMKRVQGTPLQETLSPSQKLRCRNRSGPASAASPKQKKRGHKTKKFPEPPTLPSDPKPEGDGDTFPIDPHRRHILESNRIAATKFRLRKRDEASALATMQQAVKDQNRHLSSSFDSLLAEKYIAHGVKTSAGNMEGAKFPSIAVTVWLIHDHGSLTTRSLNRQILFSNHPALRYRIWPATSIGAPQQQPQP